MSEYKLFSFELTKKKNQHAITLKGFELWKISEFEHWWIEGTFKDAAQTYKNRGESTAVLYCLQAL